MEHIEQNTTNPMPSIPQKKRGIGEKLVFLGALCIVMSIGFVYVKVDIRNENEKTLIYQLRTLRAAMQMHVKMYQAKPNNLMNLVKRLKENSNAIMLDWKNLQITKDGWLLDPFNSPYQYDRETGAIRSSTKGYESW